MGDSRDAGRGHLSPEWMMVLARFDDYARQLANVEKGIRDGKAETASELSEIRDQITRTRDEVASAAERNREALETMASRVEALENGRSEAVGAAVRRSVMHAPVDAWRGLSWPKKTGAAVTGLTVIGSMVVGIADAAPKVSRLIVRILEAIAGTPS